MPNPKLYYYKKCSTCIKAVKFLKEHAIAVELIDITTVAPSQSELRQMLSFYADDLKKLFNTSGVQYRELKMKDKIATLSTDAAMALLAGNGKLVKRPFFLSQTVGIVGFKESLWQSALVT